jgi:hypothetical protein
MPSLRLTNDNVRKIKLPVGKPVFYWDTKLKGFGIKANPTGLTFIAEGKPDGKTDRRKIGNYPEMAPDQAYDAAKQELADINKGVNRKKESRQKRNGDCFKCCVLTFC